MGGKKRIELILAGPRPTVHTNTLLTSYLINIWNIIRTSRSHRLGYYIEALPHYLSTISFQDATSRSMFQAPYNVQNVN